MSALVPICRFSTVLIAVTVLSLESRQGEFSFLCPFPGCFAFHFHMDGGSGFPLPTEIGTTSLQCFEFTEYCRFHD